jgi:hypothetical protein
MARQRTRTKTDLDVTGFLSVMSIVTGLIALILFVIALRIALNPSALKVVSFRLFTSSRATGTNIKVPSYVDCHPDRLVLYPGGIRVTWEDLQRPGNALERMLDGIQQETAKEYVIVMVRPNSVKFYRQVRNLIGKRPIDVGYDVVDKDFVVDWEAAVRALGG